VGKGAQGGKGKYELKPEFLSSYNPYFYHYTKTDKSKVNIIIYVSYMTLA
jgi:hypothetical protein